MTMDWLNTHTSPTELCVRLLMASLCGGAIGLERERLDKPAGLRTHMMVSMGAASFMLLALELAKMAGSDAAHDPIRVLQGIVAGIGFLGAGAIIQGAGSVHGITTAAGIWVVGGIGAACGAGLYGLGIIYTMFAIVIMGALGKIEEKFKKE